MIAPHAWAAQAYRATFAWIRRTRPYVTEDRAHDAVADAWVAAHRTLAMLRLSRRRIDPATGMEARRRLAVPLARDPVSRELDPWIAAACGELSARWGHLAAIRCKSKRHRARAKALPAAIAGEVLS
jgi:hypothetical protein